MSRLKSTWELKAEIAELNMPDDLRHEVNRYIEKNCINRGPGSFTGAMVRGNLHYIIDHVNDTDLTEKLRAL